MVTVPLIRTPDELTDSWLADALQRPGLTILSTERIGTGQMSQSHRITFAEDDGAPESVVLKLASDDDTSRGTGVGMGAYFREIAFYTNLAERIGSPVPGCHIALYDEAEGWFTLLLEDIAGASTGDQIAGCTVDQARTALAALAQVHGPVLNDIQVGSSAYLNLPNPLNQALLQMLLPGFLERYGDRIAPEHAVVAEQFVPSADALEAERRPPLGLVHGDFRLDNLLFSAGDCKVVDWQTLSWGPCMTDVAYFIGGALSDEDRRAHEEELVRGYHQALLDQGVTALSWDAAWEGYRRACFAGITMVVAASMVTVQTERGDDMFMAWFARNAQQVLDLGALDLLPEPGAAPVALQPDPVDEGLHEPASEELWNESYYFDAVSDDGTLGMYTRIGRLPNRDEALLTIAITGPGRPSLMVCGLYPLPGADDPLQVIDVPGVGRIEHHCVEPLKTFRITFSGTAQAHDDHAAPLRDEAGVPTPVAFDLTWETSAVPYAWRAATRYEIPCRVTGTITVDGAQAPFAGPGQRDHSWGSRDWWAVDWMWNGLHLDDGTDIHEVGIPQMPGSGIGYVQKDGEVVEISALEMDTTFTADGLVSRSVLKNEQAELHVEPIAWGALRLVAPDGRVTHFPRAMAKVATPDGRSGSGWIEWNRVQA